MCPENLSGRKRELYSQQYWVGFCEKNKSCKRKEPCSEFMSIEKSYKNHNAWSLKVRENLEHMEGPLLKCAPYPLHCDSCYLPMKWGGLSCSKYRWTNNSVSLTSILKHVTKNFNLFYSFCVRKSPGSSDVAWQSSGLAAGRDEWDSWVPLSPNGFFHSLQLGPKREHSKRWRQKLQISLSPASATTPPLLHSAVENKSQGQLGIKGEGTE